jgi:hypothetical protein
MHLKTQKRKNNFCRLAVAGAGPGAGPGPVPATDPSAAPATTPKNPCSNENHSLRYKGFIKSCGKFLPLLNFAALSRLLTFLLLTSLVLTFLQKSRHSRNLGSADAVPFPTESVNIIYAGLEELSEEPKKAGGIRDKVKKTKTKMSDGMYPHHAKRSRSKIGVRNRARAMMVITETISSSDERTERELVQERRLIGSLRYGAASMPPSNQRPAQNNAISSSTAGKTTQYFKFPMNRWCNFDPKDPSWDTITNPNCAHKIIIDPIIPTTDFDSSSSGIDSTMLATLAEPTEDIPSDQEVTIPKEHLKMIEDMIYAAGETPSGTGSDSDIAEVPVARNLEGAGAVPTPTTMGGRRL